nr:hypothetical protein [Tanacetum cinerariifolium]
QPAKSSKAKGLTVLSEVALTKAEQVKLATKKSLTQAHISHASRSGVDKGTGIILDNDEDSHGMNVKGDKGANEEDEAYKLYRDVNINLTGRDVQMVDVQTTQVIKDTHVTLTLLNPEGQQQSSSVSSRFVLNMLNLSPDTSIDSIFKSTPRVDVLVMTTAELPLLSTITLPPPSIPIISHEQQTPAPSPANEQVKEQVKVQVSKILPKIKKTVNEQLEAEVLTRFSNSSNTSHVVAADLSELELKKILNDKMESNKSIHISDEQNNLYKALVDAYECDKLIFNIYGDTVTLKRHRDDEDKDEEPFVGSNRRSKRRRTGKEPESTSAPKENTSKISGKSTKGSKSHHKTTSESAPAEEKMHTTQDLEELVPQEFEIGQQYLHDLLKPLPVIPNSQGRRPNQFINNDLEYLHGGASIRKYTTSVIKTKATDYGNIKWIEDLVPHTMWSQVPVSYDKHALCGISHWGRKRQQFYGSAVNREYAQDVYSKRRIIEGNFKRLRIQDIEDMLLLLVQGKLTNLTVNERFAFNVSLRMFTRSIVIQRRVEDLQLGVESYQKKLNLTKPDTYRSYFKCKEAYTAYSNPRGFIYQNKDK